MFIFDFRSRETLRYQANVRKWDYLIVTDLREFAHQRQHQLVVCMALGETPKRDFLFLVRHLAHQSGHSTKKRQESRVSGQECAICSDSIEILIPYKQRHHILNREAVLVDLEKLEQLFRRLTVQHDLHYLLWGEGFLLILLRA